MYPYRPPSLDVQAKTEELESLFAKWKEAAQSALETLLEHTREFQPELTMGELLDALGLRAEEVYWDDAHEHFQ